MFQKKKHLAAAVTAVIAAVPSPVTMAQLVLEEVIVTATRRAESVQDVAMSITAISSSDVQDYNLFRFDDLEQLSPGLQLDSQGAIGSRAQLRGVGFDTNSSAAPAVDVYYNETPVDANFAFQSIYDIGQAEVLRGPQGLLRGRPSPAGAITLTSRKPEFGGIGGYVSGSGGDEGTYNTQAALNVPLIEDTLAVRIAGVYDEDEGNHVESVNSGEQSERETTSWRAALRWAITDSIDATLSHQWLESDRTILAPVEGAGAGYNGPVIGDREYKSVMERFTGGTQKSKITTLAIEWELDNHRLVYNGAYQDNSYEFDQELDIFNGVTDYPQIQNVPTDFEVDSHELRLESTAPDQFMDYLVGLWYYDGSIEAGFTQPTPQPGAFGDPLQPSPFGPPDPDYIVFADGAIPVDNENKAIYANLDFHLTERTDLSVGARYLEDENKRTEIINTSDATIAVPLGTEPGVPIGFCGGLVGLGVGFTGEEPWPGSCELQLDAATSSIPGSSKDEEWIYGFNLKHYFTDDLMAYARYDHSFRSAGTTVGITSPVSDPTLIQGDPEESDSYEIGLRSDWLDGRLRVNVSAFHQDFENYIGRFSDVPYVGPGDQIIAADGFTYPADATVDGFEIDVTGEITDNWWAQFNVAYSDGEYDDATVPCRDTNGDGQPDSGDIGNLTIADFTGADGTINSVLYCEVDYAISTIPNWVGLLRSEYTFPLSIGEAYIRGLYNYYGDRDNQGGRYEADAYGVLDLFIGLRSDSAQWEVSLWARNLLDDDTRLERGEPQTVFGAFPSGYYEAEYVEGREIGLTLRYQFGEG
jgi:iron complex outermembrane receptor protein